MFIPGYQTKSDSTLCKVFRITEISKTLGNELITQINITAFFSMAVLFNGDTFIAKSVCQSSEGILTMTTMT